MWWLDPGKEVLNVLFNRILAPYVENLDLDQVNYGIGQGQLTLNNLRLKKDALDKFRLPVDVLQGHLGKLSLSLHWLNLGNQPVEVLVEDVYLLVVPSSETLHDLQEDEKRAHAAKLERIENAELLHMRSQTEASTQSQGLWESIIAKIINNLQITIRNIHIRYEDNLSVPGHPFATGVTLSGFTAVSVNGAWNPAFIESTAGAIHKLANLQSLALYFDTDSRSVAELSSVDFQKRICNMISHGERDSPHQFILKPVSGEGRIVVNHKINDKTPRFDIQLIFDEIGVALDDKQYRDIISLLDMYHVYVRQRQYSKYRSRDHSMSSGKSRLLFAATVVLEGIRERNRKWTWSYFAERRDDRNQYIDLFKKKILNVLTKAEFHDLDALERKLSYEDIRFYRSLARSRLRKDQALRARLEGERKTQASQQSWTNWLWGSSASATSNENSILSTMTVDQRKELFAVLDYDEKEALDDPLQVPRDSLKARISTILSKGSFTLRTNPLGDAKEVMSVVFDIFQASFLQRPCSFEASISLGKLGVFDNFTINSLYHQIVRVKEGYNNATDKILSTSEGKLGNEPFFSVKFEKNPPDETADSALIMRMRPLEIIYHRSYVEAVYQFLKPPASQLESIEALLSVASRTLEGLRKETRAGLEFALQTHKTINIHVNMNAPIIIIPEEYAISLFTDATHSPFPPSVTSHDCNHLIIDAGHISIESDLVNKGATEFLHLKRNKKYEDQDYEYLESLMYDKFLLKLDAAQFIIGNNLKTCLDALDNDSSGCLHLLERITIDFKVQNSIVPTVASLARFKVSGKLPSLTVNFSDQKYKALMRLIDVCIPKFVNGTEFEVDVSGMANSTPVSFPLPNALFGPANKDYVVEVDGDVVDNNDDTSHEDLFFEADDGTNGFPDLHQHVFELKFQVDKLRTRVSKSISDDVEKPLGEICFERFVLALVHSKYDLAVDINLRSLALDLVQQCMPQRLKFISSADTSSPHQAHQDLLMVTYTKVQKESPEFASVFNCIDQTIDFRVSTFIFRAAPEPVISLYEFVMTTFASQDGHETMAGGNQISQDIQEIQQSNNRAEGKMRILVKLASVQVVLVHESRSFVTLSLSTADVTVFLSPQALCVTGRLGSLALSNDTQTYAILEEFNHIMSIEGQSFAEFRYQTFDPAEESYSGFKSSVYLNAASVKLHYLEEPLRDIYLFVTQLAKLKGFYDAAAQAAVRVQSASTVERMHFEISIKTPILVFPSDSSKSRNTLVMKLGEISAQNSLDLVANKIAASLSGVQLVSIFYYDQASTLKIIENIDINADIVQTTGIDRETNRDSPDTKVAINVSDVKLHLTQVQYELLVKLSESVLQFFETSSNGQSSTIALNTTKFSEATVDLEPELRMPASASTKQNWTSLDLVVSVNVIKLHLYDVKATAETNLRAHGIARFSLSDNTLRFKSLSDGSGEVQVILRSFTMSNTRPGNTRFREIIPAAQHDRNQFMILYTMSGGTDSVLVLSIDSPKVLFAIDPVFALLEFFTSTHLLKSARMGEEQVPSELANDTRNGHMNFRIDLHDLSVSVLENDLDSNCQAITLSVDQIVLSQQGIMALSVNRLGMSLMQMGKVSESVRFLDDIDLTMSLDSRSSVSHKMTNIEIAVKPIIFRASYGDLNMITSIINKAISLFGSINTQNCSEANTTTSTSSSNSARHGTRDTTLGNAHVLVSNEQLTGSFDGFRFVLISDMNEQPMLHLKMKPFILGAKDWSGELQATTTMAIQVTYWNLTNSHWEPLIDPWVFTIGISKDATSCTNVTLSARERLDVNFSATLAELITTSVKLSGIEDDQPLQKSRGIYAPYRIRNRTGSAILVWSDMESTSGNKDLGATKILNDEIADWRFDDWKTMREHVSSGQHSIGLQIVGKTWEQIRNIRVDCEGEFVFSLRPRTKHSNRLLCEVKVVDNVKVITIRSTYQIENQTLYPLELTVVDDAGHPVYSLEKIAPGQDYSLPIEAVTQNRIRIQPDQGFGYKWCSAIRFEGLLTKKSFTIKCPHTDSNEAAFRFQAWVKADLNDCVVGMVPKINLKLRAPLELENLLPYNLEYRIYDKNTDQNWRSYLRKGGVMPVHSVELSHFVLLNISIQDSDTLAKAFPFLLSHPQDGHEYIFMVGNSAWSKIISVEAPAAETALVIRSQKQKSDEVHVGLTWSEGIGKYKLTKVITLAPRFMIKNNLSKAISFREHGAPPRDRPLIEPGERRPVHVMRMAEEKLFTIAYPGLNAQWSSPINVEDIGTVYFRLRIPNHGVSEFGLSQEWPFTIENDSGYTVRLCQQDINSYEQVPSAKAYPTYIVGRHSSIPYAWDYPAAKDKKIVLHINNARRVVDIMEIGVLIPFKFNIDDQMTAVSLDIRANGHRQVLRITDYSPEHSVYKPRPRSSPVLLARQDTLSSNPEAFEAVAEQVSPILTFTLDLAGIGVSLVNKRVVEVLYVLLDALKMEYTNSAVAQAFNMSCGTVQVDNQLHDALYPVVIQPTPVKKESTGVAALPTVQISVLWLKDQEADEDLLFALYELIQIDGTSWERGTEDVLIQNIDTILEPLDDTVGQELYFEILELQPIKLSLSFMRTERVSSEEKLSIRNPLAVVVNALTMTVGNINDAPLELNALGIKDMRLTMPELQTRILYHYRQDILRQLYRILGSADFIGNPVGLFTNVSSGVADIFYEPFHGVVMHGNKELGIGIAKGAASFVKKTVFGLSDSVTKFTSSVGKGLSAATFDSEYQARRRMAQRRNKPRHAIYGVAAGGEAFANSVTSAMEGVLMKPIEGAGSEGPIGFFKGVGKGLIGVVTKPVIGVFDLASNVSEGIRNTTTVFDSPRRERVRLPRHVPADKVLRPYSAREALGQYWMRDLSNGAYRHESYIAHIRQSLYIVGGDKRGAETK
ncbi:hypothetical protein C0993_002481 [Termitomyces sp. T159_Od127]|nr:hypothetical protein C0993_002481 [Termitomyces sp. T159_Od127]